MTHSEAVPLSMTERKLIHHNSKCDSSINHSLSSVLNTAINMLSHLSYDNDSYSQALRDNWESALSLSIGQSITLLYISACHRGLFNSNKMKNYFACARALSVYLNWNQKALYECPDKRIHRIPVRSILQSNSFFWDFILFSYTWNTIAWILYLLSQ